MIDINNHTQLAGLLITTLLSSSAIVVSANGNAARCTQSMRKAYEEAGFSKAFNVSGAASLMAAAALLTGFNCELEAKMVLISVVLGGIIGIADVTLGEERTLTHHRIITKSLMWTWMRLVFLAAGVIWLATQTRRGMQALQQASVKRSERRSAARATQQAQQTLTPSATLQVSRMRASGITERSPELQSQLEAELGLRTPGPIDINFERAS